MSIDAQRMFGVLEQACSKAGVEILEGYVMLWIGNTTVVVLISYHIEYYYRYQRTYAVAANGARLNQAPSLSVVLGQKPTLSNLVPHV